MTFDICFATYRSRQWLGGCIRALCQLEYDKKEIGLYFADNGSDDGTPEELQRLKTEFGADFAAFEILSLQKNRGFGAASNAAAGAGSGRWILFLNIDTEIAPDALEQLQQAIGESGPDWGAFELRQLPYEYPKYYCPITMETSWASAAALAVRREAFEQLGGFDETIFMYAEDVDLSWRLRLQGYRIRYLPQAAVLHYAYRTAGEVKPLQLAGSLTSNLILREKYGTRRDIADWRPFFDAALASWGKEPKVAGQIESELAKIRENRPAYRRFYRKQVKGSGFTPKFLGLDYEFARGGAFYKNHLPAARPLISVIVRTYRRPEVLALTLQSLGHQTYRNFEVIVVEDGDAPCAQQVAKAAKGWLQLRYLAANQHIGRCAAGNLGLQAARGVYLCFLDDDDYFFAEHLEVMACLAEENPAAGLLVAGSIEARTSYYNKEQTRFSYTLLRNLACDGLSPVSLCVENQFPIQAVLFKRELFEQYGGFDPELKALEDWELWVRYLAHTTAATVQKATSIYKVPSEPGEWAARESYINENEKLLYEKLAAYEFRVSAQALHRLHWDPAVMVEEKGRQQQELEALRRTLAEICGSGSWRATAPLRLAFAAVEKLLFLVAFLLQLPGRLAAALAQGWRSVAEWVGPQPPDPAAATPKQLHRFAQQAPRSLSLRLPAAIRALVRRLKRRQ